ncbi:MAG: ABC transporter substrate-binding protein [Nitrospirae bacterium]|nr:ABC transporter substrate-binding protein [Nitrospirota bacterium]
MYRRVFGAFIIFALIVLLILSFFSCGGSGGSNSSKTVVIGALLAKTGSLSSMGLSAGTALNLAVGDVNAYLTQQNAGFTIALQAVDTQTDPAVALVQARSLASSGIKVAVGPQSSGEAQSILDWANSNGFIMISPPSTAPSLAIAGDNLFRMTPDDTHQAVAVTSKMESDKIQAIVPIWRDDIYGDELVSAAVSDFQYAGGLAMSGVKYDTSTTNFAPQVAALKTQVAAAVNKYGASRVAVYIVAFEEFINIFQLAANDPVLSSVKWYGNDACAVNSTLLNNAAASGFAYSVNLACTSFEAGGTSSDAISGRIAQVTGQTPDTYALAAYDALWIIAKAYMKAGVWASTADLKSAIVSVADHYYGATGVTLLNDAGDLEYGLYTFWQLSKNTKGYTWTTTSGVVR